MKDLGYIPPDDRFIEILNKLVSQNDDILRFNRAVLEMIGRPLTTYELKLDPKLRMGEEE